MGDPEREPERIWERGWDGHARRQRARLAALSLEEKIRWLEDAQRLVERLRGLGDGHDDDRQAARHRKLTVSGTANSRTYCGPFVGSVVLQRRPECVYYVCRLESPQGLLLLYVARPVSNRVVPPECDPLEYAAQHAIAGIDSYRSGRCRPYTVTNWTWDGE